MKKFIFQQSISSQCYYSVKMLSRLRLIYLNTPFAKFSTLDEERGRNITRLITYSKSSKDLKNILSKNKNSFNLYNMSALLKKLNLMKIDDSQTLNLAFAQLKQCIKTKKQPSPETARALSNIIGYTGNRNYKKVNQQIKQINFIKLYQILLSNNQEKQFVMTTTGLLKLGLIDQIMKEKQLKQLLQNYLVNACKLGLVVSLWRNIIKQKKADQQLDIAFVEKIQKFYSTLNIKDFGYLVYCFTQRYQVLSRTKNKMSISYSDTLFKSIYNLSQKIIQSTRLSMNQLCIFLDSFQKLTQLTNLQPTSQFIDNLRFHYLRIIKSHLDLRSIANGYLSMFNFKGIVDEEIHNFTIDKFNQILLLQKVNEDYQSVTSLFVQLVTTKPSSKDSITQRKSQLSRMLQLTLQFLFSQKNKPQIVRKLSNKEFQKILYGFYLFKKQNPEEVERQLKKIHKQKIMLNLAQRQDLTAHHITSMVVFCYWLGLKDKTVCDHFRNLVKKQLNQNITSKIPGQLNSFLQKKAELEQIISRACIIGKKQNCFCLQKNADCSQSKQSKQL